MNCIKILLASGAMTLVALAAPPTLARPLNVDDFDRFADIGEVQISADGAWVAYVVGTVDRAADEQRSAIWIVRWDGTKQELVTASLKHAGTPRWSPDGRYLAFNGSATDPDESQIILLDRQSGLTRVLTDVTGDIGEFGWSPDSRRLVFVMVTGAEPPPKEGAPPQPIVIDAAYFKEDKFGYFEKGQRQHLYLANIATAKIDALTSDPQFNDDHPAWAPDGSHIAFIRTREREADVDGMGDVDVIDAAVGAQASTLVRIFTPNAQHLAWSPD